MPPDRPQRDIKKSNLWKRTMKQGGRAAIESGQCGIFVTCNRNQESKCISEMLDILSQELENQFPATQGNDDGDSNGNDIEAQIKKELEGLDREKAKAPFQAIRTEIPCVSFIRLDKSIDPVCLARRICIDAQQHPENKRSRKIQRMTPVTLVRKILGNGLEALSREVLHPVFGPNEPPKKYAIRPTIRQNTDWNRESVCKTVAGVIGPQHPVNLKNYDVLVLVEIMRNICAMSVVGPDYDQLKKYNIAEIYSPTPAPVGKKTDTDLASRGENSATQSEAFATATGEMPNTTR